MYYSMPALAVVFLTLAIFPKALSAWWKKFGSWFLPVAALVFIFYGPPSSGDLFSPAPEQVFKWISILYVAGSLAVIAWEYWQAPKPRPF